MSVCQLCLCSFFDQKIKKDEDNEILTLYNCKHVFHQNCIRWFVGHQKNQLSVPLIECPFPKCKQGLNKKEVEDLLNQAASIAKKKS
mmetsp:Transcript_28454/g.27425  ORF Transcript_28454/g.27425 Transcript_28454/m.27425 type:complete len:87 (+) Transcript_28454:604-864(+)